MQNDPRNTNGAFELLTAAAQIVVITKHKMGLNVQQKSLADFKILSHHLSSRIEENLQSRSH